jgi:hypothetical protein
MIALPPPTVAKLAKVCGLLGSDHDGERANAAAQATRLLKEAGLTWEEFVRRPCPTPQPPRQPYQQQAHDHRARARRALMRAHLLNPWQKDFLSNIAVRHEPLTPKQAGVLRKIEERLAW